MSALRCKWFGLHGEGVFGEAPIQVTNHLAEKGYHSTRESDFLLGGSLRYSV